MIRLRELQPADKEKLRTWRNRPEVAMHMYADHCISAVEHEQWFRRIAADPARRYWIIVHDASDVGLVNIYDLDWQNQRAYWAFYIAEPGTRGKGVGSFVEYSILHYAFDDQGLNKLCCEVLASNEAVVNMHKSFGFRQEGLYREHIIKGGQPFDVVTLAMLRGEWEVRKLETETRLRKKGLL